MTHRRLISPLLVTCLLLGQSFSLVHAIEHTLVSDGKGYVLCLSHTKHQYGLASSDPYPAQAFRPRRPASIRPATQPQPVSLRLSRPRPAVSFALQSELPQP